MRSKKEKVVINNKLLSDKCNKEYKEFPCDLCGSTQAVEMPYVREYTKGQVIHICKKCGLVYVKKRRPYHEIAKIWSKELFGRAYTSKTPLMLARHTYLAEFINRQLGLKGRKVYDVGAGEGQFLNIVKKNYAARVLGIEPSSRNCRIMEKMGIAIFKGTLEDYIESPDSKKGRPDILTMMWTLENATSCRDILAAAYKIIKENGYMVIATGSRILVPAAKPLNLYLSSNPADTHPVRFSKNTLSSMLTVEGFKVIYINPYLNDGILCVIARKCKRVKRAGRLTGDDFRKVCDFFRKWHRETLCYEKFQGKNDGVRLVL